MNLVDRLTEARDFEACRGLLQERSAYRPEVFARLPDVWGEMLAAGSLNSAVMEDWDRPTGRRIVQFGMTVFVTDAYVERARSGTALHVGADIVEHVLDGRSPVLSLPEIARANSEGGLNLVVLHCGFPTRSWTAEQLPLVTARLPRCFFSLHAGYQIKEILLEYYEEAFVTFALQGGFLTRADRRAAHGRQGLPWSSAAPSPHLLGVTREEAATNPGSSVAQAFAYVPPRFFFRNGEQQVLRRALMGQTDDEVAASLGLGLATIKKRWVAAYDRVSGVMPGLLPEIDAENTHLERKRGHEKRRHLLIYLSRHPEELRPWAAPLIQPEDRQCRPKMTPAAIAGSA